MRRKKRRLTRVWQNGGRSAKLSIVLLFGICGKLNICATNPARKPSAKTLATIEEVFKNVYPEAIYSMTFRDESIANFYRRENQLALVYKIFAVLSIVISSIGLYGLISFLVGQKLKEIGIRKVLGASIPQITFLLSKEFILLVFIAFAIAVPVGYYLTDQWLQNFTYKTNVPVGLYVHVILVSLLITSATVRYGP